MTRPTELPRTQQLGWRRVTDGGLRLLFRSGVVSISLALGYLVTQAGCENKAITYAKATDPDLKCDAINTTLVGDINSSDVAICRYIHGPVLKCTYTFAGDKATCERM